MTTEGEQSAATPRDRRVILDPHDAMTRFVSPEFVDHNPPPGGAASTREGVAQAIGELEAVVFQTSR